MDYFKETMEVVIRVVDAVGVLFIVGGAAIATGRFLVRCWRLTEETYREFRRELGRAILLGLEFLIAADIIRTVAVDPTLENVGVLGLIVLTRTFLSLTLELEMEGKFPWQQDENSASAQMKKS